ncbi:MAG TPA: HAD family phosphatase [bacterium]|nr:HAD family phosphatase [bacterium]
MIRYNDDVTPLRALILDYGNVLTYPQAADVIQAMAARLGVTVEAFTAAYWEHRRPYDAGEYPPADYWRRVLRSLRLRPEESNERALFDWLADRDGDSWMRYRDEVWDLARDVRARGVSTAMLSNMPVALAQCIRRDRALEEWFDVVIVSGDVHSTKPDPRIYRFCLERLDAEPAGALFVDDREENVTAAARLGMRTVHFVGDDPAAALRNAIARA